MIAKSVATCLFLSVGRVESFSSSSSARPSSVNALQPNTAPCGGHSKTALALGYLDLGSNTINTAVLHSSFASELPSHVRDDQAGGVYQFSGNATDSALATQTVMETADVAGPASKSLTPTATDLQHQVSPTTTTSSLPFGGLVSPHLGYRLLLAGVACIYGTNFPLGSIMDQALEPSAASSSRFFIAAVALSPFALKLDRDLVGPALLAGCFTAVGYISQSLALADVSPATVSFLGAATVIWCPFLEWLINKEDMSWGERPQVWIAAVLCLSGVALLELFGGDAGAVGGGGLLGDGLALLQAVGFGTGIFMSEKMMRGRPNQASSITAVSVAVTALMSMLWAVSEGWMGGAPGWESMLLPNILMAGFAGDGTAAAAGGVDPTLLARAVLWTGLVSTSMNFSLEVFALSKVKSGEASVILATEPLWAAAFASFLLGDSMGWNGIVGGMLIVSACLVNGVKTADIHRWLGGTEPSDEIA